MVSLENQLTQNLKELQRPLPSSEFFRLSRDSEAEVELHKSILRNFQQLDQVVCAALLILD